MDGDGISVNQDPLQECHLNQISPFNPFDFRLETLDYKRNRPIKRTAKRVLKLTGSSPYL